MAVTDGDRDMPGSLEPHWWAIIAGALSGFIGWRLKSAQDSVKLDNAMRDLERVENRVKALENGQVSTASSLSGTTGRVAILGGWDLVAGRKDSGNAVRLAAGGLRRSTSIRSGVDLAIITARNGDGCAWGFGEYRLMDVMGENQCASPCRTRKT